MNQKEDKFNPAFAESVGRDPEATPPTTSTATNSTPTAEDPPNEIGDQESANGGPTSHVGAIVGGVVGGVVGLVTIAAIVFFLRKRRRRTQQTHIIDLDPDMGVQWETTGMQGTHKIQRLYDPSDPSTFPVSISVTGENHKPPQAYNWKYTGSAEI